MFTETYVFYSWKTIKVGRDLNIVTPEEVISFGNKCLDQYTESAPKVVINLILGDAHEVDKHLNAILLSLENEIPERYSPAWNLEWRKWRYCIISEMLKTHTVDDVLFNAERIYADFGYPEDMKSFIHYIPAQEEDRHLTSEQAQKKLLQSLMTFLAKEKVAIDEGITTIPPLHLQE